MIALYKRNNQNIISSKNNVSTNLIINFVKILIDFDLSSNTDVTMKIRIIEIQYSSSSTSLSDDDNILKNDLNKNIQNIVYFTTYIINKVILFELSYLLSSFALPRLVASARHIAAVSVPMSLLSGTIIFAVS